MTEMFPMFAGGLFFLIWILFVLAGFIGFIIIIVSAWRIMKAHESIAYSMQEFVKEKGSMNADHDH